MYLVSCICRRQRQQLQLQLVLLCELCAAIYINQIAVCSCCCCCCGCLCCCWAAMRIGTTTPTLDPKPKVATLSASVAKVFSIIEPMNILREYCCTRSELLWISIGDQNSYLLLLKITFTLVSNFVQIYVTYVRCVCLFVFST